MVDPAVRDELRATLTSERDRLEAEITGLRNSGIRSDTFQGDESDSVDQHPADQGSELFEREKNLALLATLEVSVEQVDQALQKLDAGTYGVCETCGGPIAEKRLLALPEATHCIECQSKLDSGIH